MRDDYEIETSDSFYEGGLPHSGDTIILFNDPDDLISKLITLICNYYFNKTKTPEGEKLEIEAKIQHRSLLSVIIPEYVHLRPEYEQIILNSLQASLFYAILAKLFDVKLSINCVTFKDFPIRGYCNIEDTSKGNFDTKALIESKSINVKYVDFVNICIPTGFDSGYFQYYGYPVRVDCIIDCTNRNNKIAFENVVWLRAFLRKLKTEWFDVNASDDSNREQIFSLVSFGITINPSLSGIKPLDPKFLFLSCFESGSTEPLSVSRETVKQLLVDLFRIFRLTIPDNTTLEKDFLEDVQVCTSSNEPKQSMNYYGSQKTSEPVDYYNLQKTSELMDYYELHQILKNKYKHLSLDLYDIVKKRAHELYLSGVPFEKILDQLLKEFDYQFLQLIREKYQKLASDLEYAIIQQLCQFYRDDMSIKDILTKLSEKFSSIINFLNSPLDGKEAKHETQFITLDEFKTILEPKDCYEFHEVEHIVTKGYRKILSKSYNKIMQQAYQLSQSGMAYKEIYNRFSEKCMSIMDMINLLEDEEPNQKTDCSFDDFPSSLDIISMEENDNFMLQAEALFECGEPEQKTPESGDDLQDLSNSITPTNESKQTKEPIDFNELDLIPDNPLDPQDIGEFFHEMEILLATEDAKEQAQKPAVSNNSQDSSTITSRSKQTKKPMDYYDLQRIIEDRYRSIVPPNLYDRVILQAYRLYQSGMPCEEILDRLSEESDFIASSLVTDLDYEEPKQKMQFTTTSEPKQTKEPMDYFEFQRILENKYRGLHPSFYNTITEQAELLYLNGMSYEEILDEISKEYDPVINSLAAALDEEDSTDVRGSLQDSTITNSSKQTKEPMDYFEFQRILENKYHRLSPELYNPIIEHAKLLYKSGMSFEEILDEISKEHDPVINSLMTAFDEEEPTEVTHAKGVNAFI